jgi:hypothetical protein
VTATATVEVQAGPDGNVEMVEATATTEQLVNGDVAVDVSSGGPQMQQQQMAQQPQPQRPPLYDMDLERMHVDLYKGKYLSPQDFLGDILRIVHNAEIRQHEDLDRLYKAQAMLTAAEVSMHDFDPHFKVECERMASRERQRREERRKGKNKGKSTDAHAQNGAGYAPGTRRSARNNGQEPELSITDPLKLERRLKRQRNVGDAAIDSLASEEEHSDARTMKRSKVGSEDDPDPLDVVGPTSIPRPIGVRFAVEPIEPMEPLQPLQPTEPLQPLQLNGASHPEQERMVVDTPPRRPRHFLSVPDPFDTSDGDVFTVGLGAFPSTNPAEPQSQPVDPQSPHSSSQEPRLDQGMSVENLEGLNPNIREGLADSHRPSPGPMYASTPVHDASLPVEQQDLSPLPMVVQRTPSPPLPQFHVDETVLLELKSRLRDNTHFLNVEQLEQLRATCLGAVWRNRSSWNRGELLSELFTILKSFTADIRHAHYQQLVPNPLSC